MTNSRSSFLTDAPGLKFTCSRNPATRARSSTSSYGSVVPVYSRYLVTGLWTGCATVTSAGGGGAYAFVFGLQLVQRAARSSESVVSTLCAVLRRRLPTRGRFV